MPVNDVYENNQACREINFIRVYFKQNVAALFPENLILATTSQATKMRYSTLFVLMMAFLIITADGFLNIKKVFKKIGKKVSIQSKGFGLFLRINMYCCYIYNTI